jgi:hypothetical protein
MVRHHDSIACSDVTNVTSYCRLVKLITAHWMLDDVLRCAEWGLQLHLTLSLTCGAKLIRALS